MIRRFHFRLARILRTREIRERVARAEWAASERLAHDAEARSEELRRAADAAGAAVLAMRSEPELSANDLLASERAVENIWNALRQNRERASGLRAASEESHLRWSEHEKDRQALVRLEERRRAQHQYEVERSDGAELDEWAASSHRRRGASSRSALRADENVPGTP